MYRIAIFASGAGSNAAKIIEHFHDHSTVKVGLILSGSASAGVLAIASQAGIDSLVLEKEGFFNSSYYVDILKKNRIDFIVLAGFLWKIPASLVQAYPGRIVNIHPALLPNYGGKGMYGRHVHEAVISAKEQESGITIHYVDEQYDHGQTIFQARVAILPTDTPSTLAEKIHQLEHEHFPRVIEEVIHLQNHR